MVQTVALFGEAEKGHFSTAYLCQSLHELQDHFGNPPEDSSGLHCAVQILLYQRQILFFRVRQEGFSREDYFHGLDLLSHESNMPNLSAICLPGVGDALIIEASGQVCSSHHGVLILQERDLFDYLSHLRDPAHLS